MKKVHKRVTVIMILGCILTFILIFCFLMTFQNHMSMEVDQQMDTHLKELALQIGDIIKMKMDNCVREVECLSVTIETMNQPIDTTIIPLLRDFAENSTITRFSVVTRRGDVYSSSDFTIKPSSFRFGEAVYQGESGITDIFISGATKEQVISIYKPVYRRGEVVAGVFGTIVIRDLNDMLSFSGFNGEGYSYLMQKDGKTVMSTRHRNQIKDSVNFYQFLDEMSTNPSMSGDELKQHVKNKDSGYLTYKVGKQTRKAYYQPVDFKDWYIVSIVPLQVLQTHYTNLYTLAVSLTVKTMVAFGLMLGLILIWSVYSKKRLQRAHDRIASSNKKYEIAMQHTKNHMFEYDAANDVLIFASKGLLDCLQTEVAEKIPAISQLSNKLFTDDSVSKASACIKQALGQEETILDLEKKDGQWIRVTLSTVQQSGGKNLIGTVENITKYKELESQYCREEEYCQFMLQESLFGFSIDLESSKILYVSTTSSREEVLFDYLAEEVISTLFQKVHPDYYSEVCKLFHPRTLKSIHKRGVREISEHFMLEISDKKFIWACVTLHFLNNPSNGHGMIFAYVRNVNDEKSRELELAYRSERDGLTGLFNRITFTNKVDENLHHTSPDSYSALMMMDLDGFKQINDEYGHQAGDNLLRSIATLLTNCVPKDQLTGRIGGDEFVIFIHNIPERDTIIDIANDIRRQVEKLSLDEYDASIFTASIGVAFCKDTDTFDTVYPRADKVLYRAKREGKNRVYLSEE